MKKTPAAAMIPNLSALLLHTSQRTSIDLPRTRVLQPNPNLHTLCRGNL
jgi:hypothetical protein